MRGVKAVEGSSLYACETLDDVECYKLEIIGFYAFNSCQSLRSINLPSARIVGHEAFFACEALLNVNFGDMLETIEERAFCLCESLGNKSLSH